MAKQTKGRRLEQLALCLGGWKNGLYWSEIFISQTLPFEVRQKFMVRLPSNYRSECYTYIFNAVKFS
jgi:hypothetical protein